MLDNSEIYDRYQVLCSVVERLDGGVPKDPELIRAWVAARTGHDDEETEKQIAEHMPDIDAATEDVASGMWCGFKRVDGDGDLYLDARQVKAMLRECATVLGITKKKRGSRQILQHAFEIKGTGDPASRVLLEPAPGESEVKVHTHEGAIHVMTAQGPRSAIKRNDYVGPGTRIRFEIWVLKTAPQETRHLGEKELTAMLALAQENGLGANRSQGMGKIEIVEFARID